MCIEQLYYYAWQLCIWPCSSIPLSSSVRRVTRFGNFQNLYHLFWQYFEFTLLLNDISWSLLLYYWCRCRCHYCFVVVVFLVLFIACVVIQVMVYVIPLIVAVDAVMVVVFNVVSVVVVLDVFWTKDGRRLALRHGQQNSVGGHQHDVTWPISVISR